MTTATQHALDRARPVTLQDDFRALCADMDRLSRLANKAALRPDWGYLARTVALGLTDLAQRAAGLAYTLDDAETFEPVGDLAARH